MNWKDWSQERSKVHATRLRRAAREKSARISQPLHSAKNIFHSILRSNLLRADPNQGLPVGIFAQGGQSAPACAVIREPPAPSGTLTIW